MSQDIYVKETVTKGGKKKYKAEIWFGGKFYTSKTVSADPKLTS
jgi:hypothetical protein